MEFKEKLQILRKENKLSQEDLAEKLRLSRQAVAKWELGQSYPDINNLINLSDFFKVSIDHMVRDSNGQCTRELIPTTEINHKETIAFLRTAKKKTYAGKGMEESISSRPASHDLYFYEGKYTYIDTYLGGEKFSGEEAVWFEESPIWAMNYTGRILKECFSGDFLKEALLLVPENHPFRGPLIYQQGDYTYHCTLSGEFDWFQGYEEIFCKDEKVYECYFHGGTVK